MAAGLCGAAIGSDGAGSIRIPAACCGLFGLKPQNGRVPTAPAVEPWHGMSTWGAMTRGVADSALVYDAIKDGGPSFAEAAAREPGRLTIAVSLKTPPLTGVQADDEQLERRERGRRGAARARARGGRARDRVPDHAGRQRALALPARDRRPGALDAAPRAPVAPHARLPADRLGDPGRAARSAPSRPPPRTSGRSAVEGVDAVLDSDVHAPAAARGRVRRPPGAVDLPRLGALRALRRPVQPHRPAGGVGARGLDGRRLPGRRAARRAARRRAAAALARAQLERALRWTERRPAMAT